MSEYFSIGEGVSVYFYLRTHFFVNTQGHVRFQHFGGRGMQAVADSIKASH